MSLNIRLSISEFFGHHCIKTIKVVRVMLHTFSSSVMFAVIFVQGIGLNKSQAKILGEVLLLND